MGGDTDVERVTFESELSLEILIFFIDGLLHSILLSGFAIIKNKRL